MRRPSRDQLAEHLAQAVELRRAAPSPRPPWQLQQARVAARLTQFQQRVENDDPAAREALVGDRLAHPSRASPAGSTRRFRAAPVSSSMRSTISVFGGSSGRHLRLGAAQDERADAAWRAAGRARRRPSSRSACGSAWLKCVRIAEEARRGEREQRPEFAQVVFERRAGQAEPVARLQARESASSSPRPGS